MKGYKVCPYCSETFKLYNSLQPCCPKTECINKHRSKKEVDKRVKVMRKESKSKPELKALAKVIFQQWVRLAKAAKCISCGSITSKMDAGHFFSANQYSGVIFNEDNVWPQCHHCNRFLHGNIQAYGTELAKQIGSDRYQELCLKANITRLYKYSCEELSEITSTYREKIKQLKSTIKE